MGPGKSFGILRPGWCQSEEQVLENAGAVGWFMEKEDRNHLGSLGI